MISHAYSEGFLLAAGISPDRMNSIGTECWAGDFKLLDEWISQGTKHSLTRRVMKKEVERLLLWAISVKRKGLLELNSTDISNYAKFLERPTPISIWVSKTKYPKCNDVWRPFAGPLNESSRRYALVQVGSFFKWAVRSGLIEFDPTEAQEIPRINKPICRPPALAQEAIDALFEVIDNQKKIKKRLRDTVLFSILLQVGLLVSEIVAANIDDVDQGESGACWIIVRSDSGKLRKLAITSELYLLIGFYKTAFGIQVAWMDDTAPPLVLPVTGKLRRLHTSTILAIIKDITQGAICLLRERGQHEVAATLKGANGYMLRHSCFASIATTNTVMILKKVAGYLELETAGQYFYLSEDDFYRRIVESLPAIPRR
jgi:site-specific recombinase XerD